MGRDPRPRTGSLPSSQRPHPVALPSTPPSPLSSHSFHPGLGVSPPPTFSRPKLHGVACGRPVSPGAGARLARWAHIPQASPPPLNGCGVPGASLPGMSGDFLPSASLPPNAHTQARNTFAHPCGQVATPSEGPPPATLGRCGEPRGLAELRRGFRGVATTACAGRRRCPGGLPSSVAFTQPEGPGGFRFLLPPSPNTRIQAGVHLRVWGAGNMEYFFPSAHLRSPAPKRLGGLCPPGLAAAPPPPLTQGPQRLPALSRAALKQSHSSVERGVASFSLLWVWGWGRGRGSQHWVPDRCPRGGAGVSLKQI